jgi:ferrous iron transport protein B
MLTSQLVAFGKPMVLALNMIDEACSRGSIDAEAPSAALGIPVVEMLTAEGRDLPELRDALALAARPDVPAHPHAGDRAVWAATSWFLAEEPFCTNRPSVDQVMVSGSRGGAL